MLYEETETASIDELLTEYIRALVGVPEEVEIEKTESSTTLIYTIDVVHDDRGKIIGRSGSIINSLKIIFKALGCKHGKKVILEIKE